jgi:large subunit ribosomal protein L9
MKVVFFEDVEGTALVGDVKDVKNGFARNFLLPRGIAGPTTKDNMQRANSLAQKETRRQEKLDAEARGTSGKLEGLEISIEARVGETGRLFGSVTNRDIAEAIKAKSGIEVDPHIVLLPEPIRDLGPRPVTVKFTRNVLVDVMVDVTPDEASKPIVEKLEAERAAQAAADAKAAAEAKYRAEHGAPAADSLVAQATARYEAEAAAKAGGKATEETTED